MDRKFLTKALSIAAVVGLAFCNSVAQANENNISMSFQGANATWQSTANNEILKQVRNDSTTTLSLVGEGRVRYEQDAVQNHTSSAYGTFSYSLGEGRLAQNDNNHSAPMGEVARSAEGELISTQSHTTGISKLTGSLRNSILPIQGGKLIGASNTNTLALGGRGLGRGGTLTGAAADTQFPRPLRERDRERGVLTGAAAQIVDLTPTRGDEAGYSLKDEGEANTTIAVPIYSIDTETGKAILEATKYVDIKKTTYNKGTLDYSWDDTTKRLTVTQSGGSSKINGVEYVGQSTTALSYRSSNYQQMTIGNISGDFVNNTGDSVSAIYLDNIKTDSISGNFIGNSSKREGSAIYYYDCTANTTADFIGNTVEKNSGTRGGAIRNYRPLGGNITGDFIGNSISGTSGDGRGAGICVYGQNDDNKLNNISGNFIGNNISYSQGHGAAIAITFSRQESITGNFINNTVNADRDALGGAIYNDGTITTLLGNFIGNSAKGCSYSYIITGGGAIANGGYINNLSGYFANNYATTRGGAIYNFSGGGIILGDSVFSNNQTQSKPNDIYNENGTITIAENATVTLDGGFDSGAGGYQRYTKLIMNEGSTLNLNIDNGTIQQDNLGNLTNNGTINLAIDIDFANKRADTISTYSVSQEGFVNLTGFNILGGTIDDFIASNGKIQILKTQQGGLQLSLSEDLQTLLDIEKLVSTDAEHTIDEIQANTPWDRIYYDRYTGNITKTYGKGGLATTSTLNDSIGIVVTRVENIEGEPTNVSLGDTLYLVTKDTTNPVKYFSANSADNVYDLTTDIGQVNGTLNIVGLKSDTVDSNGIKTSKYSTIDFNGYQGFVVDDNITLNIENVSLNNSNEGAIFNRGRIETITGKFVSNNAGERAQGGAIYNANKITTLESDFINNIAGEYGGAIYNVKESFADKIMQQAGLSTFEDLKNVIISEGMNPEEWGIHEKSDFTLRKSVQMFAIGAKSAEEMAERYGWTVEQLNDVLQDEGFSSFDEYVDYYANMYSAEFNLAQGEITFSGKSTFTNNKANGELNDIYNDGVINLLEDAEVTSNSGINGDNGTGVINLAPNSKLNINHYLTGQTVNLDNGEINLGSHLQEDGTTTYGSLDLVGLTTTALGGSLNAINNHVAQHNLGAVTLNGNLNMTADVDLANEVMDSVNATSYDGTGNIVVKGMNLLSDTAKDSVSLLFANDVLKDHVTSDVSEIGKDVSNSYQTTAYSPIYKYNVAYNNKDDAGYFEFTKLASLPGGGGSNTPKYEALNPAIMALPVAAQAGAQSAMNQAMYFSFEHGDTFMNNGAADRFALMNSNTYALSTDYNENGERMDYNNANKAVWVKPYAVFENLPLRNGPKVNSISYGTLVGFDSDFHKMKKGWTNVGTAYIGYNGSQLKYSGVDTSTNGGMLGVTETFYKGNFWTALTATTGASVAEANTMYGHDNMTSLMAGVGSKTGYNFEFADGKFIIQPRIFLAYSMIKTFDYTNAAGVRINSDPLHTIQINPAIKFIGNIKDWQPYASVGMNWNLINQTKVSANGVKLPEMHQKPYVEYGVGVQKHWNNKYSAYLQAMVRNGGRNGIALSLGFKAALGKEGKPIEKVQEVNNKQAKATASTSKDKSDKKILKQVRNDNKQVQNNKSTAQNGNKRVLKSLSSTKTSMIGKIK